MSSIDMSQVRFLMFMQNIEWLKTTLMNIKSEKKLEKIITCNKTDNMEVFLVDVKLKEKTWNDWLMQFTRFPVSISQKHTYYHHQSELIYFIKKWQNPVSGKSHSDKNIIIILMKMNIWGFFLLLLPLWFCMKAAFKKLGRYKNNFFP